MSTLFVRPSAANAPKLNTFMGQVIAMTWTRDATVPTVVEGESRQTKAAEAYIVEVNLDEKIALGRGTTLVFPQVLQQTLRNSKGQYIVGRLIKQERDNGFSVILLEDLSDEDHEAAVTLISEGYFLPPVSVED